MIDKNRLQILVIKSQKGKEKSYLQTTWKMDIVVSNKRKKHICEYHEKCKKKENILTKK